MECVPDGNRTGGSVVQSFMEVEIILKRKKLLRSLIPALILLSLSAQPVLAAGKDVRISIEQDGYSLAKYEPEQGIYLGAYIEQDELIGADPLEFNRLTGKKHASFFRYVGYGRMVPESWLERMRLAEAAPHVALEPNNGLQEVQDDDYLRSLARQLNDFGGPVFLRYASEMNGDWAAYSGDPELYIEKWKLVHDVMAQEAPNVIMVWTVFTFPQSTILTYYPGDEYVDWVGVNIYNVIYHNNNLNHRAAHQDPLDLLDYVYRTFADRKPIQISEYGATHFTTTDGQYYPEWASEKITRLYEGLLTSYPRVKSIFYFNTNNLANAPEGRRINDYSLTTDTQVLAAYGRVVSHPGYLTEIGENREGEIVRNTFPVQEGYFLEKGTTWVSSVALNRHFGYQVRPTDQSFRGLGPKEGKMVPYDEAQRIVRNGRSYFPIRYLADTLGYQVSYNPSTRKVVWKIQDPDPVTAGLQQ